MRDTLGGRPLGPAATFLAGLLLLPAATSGRSAPQDTSAEELEDLDPYTAGEREPMAELGILSFGPIYFGDGRTSSDVASIIGTDEILFLETAHFRIASTLGTYEQSGDSLEKDRLRTELSRLGKKNRRIKAKAKARDLDPWLRAHLYAQRLEEVWDEFVALFVLREEDFPPAPVEGGLASPPTAAPQPPAPPHPMGRGPYLGQPQKFAVLLSGNASGLGRFCRGAFGIEQDLFQRWTGSDSMFYGVSFESLKAHERELDICLHVNVVGSIVLNFLDSFRDSRQAVPYWFKYGLAHWFARRIDPRWSNWGAGGPSVPDEDRQWEWEPRVRGLVANDAASSWEDTFAWTDHEAAKPRDHMVVWSRVAWLVEERRAELRSLLMGLSEPLPDIDPAARAQLWVDRQRRALESSLGMGLAEIDEDWRKFVLRKYPK